MESGDDDLVSSMEWTVPANGSSGGTLAVSMLEPADVLNSTLSVSRRRLGDGVGLPRWEPSGHGFRLLPSDAALLCAPVRFCIKCHAEAIKLAAN